MLRARSRHRQLDGQGELGLVTPDAELHRLALVLGFALRSEFLAQIAHATDALAVYRSDDVTGFYAGPFCGRARIHFADQNAFAIGSPKERAQLAVQVLRVNPQARLTAHQESAAVPFHGRNRWDFRHAKGEGARSARRSRSKHSKRMAAVFGFPKGYAQRLGAPVTPDRDLRRASSGDFADDAAKLRHTFDALPVDFRDDVVFLESRFCGGAVWNDRTDNHTALGGKLKFLGRIAADLIELNAEPACAVFVQQEAEVIIPIRQLREGLQLLNRLAVLRESQLRRRQHRIQLSQIGELILLAGQLCLGMFEFLL